MRRREKAVVRPKIRSQGQSVAAPLSLWTIHVFHSMQSLRQFVGQPLLVPWTFFALGVPLFLAWALVYDEMVSGISEKASALPHDRDVLIQLEGRHPRAKADEVREYD